jgi:hypothetical protein
MKPVMQTRDGWPAGNCLMAATASILECELEELPDVFDESERRGGHEAYWWAVYLEALRARGFAVACISNGKDGYPTVSPIGWAIASLEDECAAVGHAAVALDGRIVHDPHPLRPSQHMHVAAWYVLVPLVRSR